MVKNKVYIPQIKEEIGERKKRKKKKTSVSNGKLVRDSWKYKVGHRYMYRIEHPQKNHSSTQYRNTCYPRNCLELMSRSSLEEI